MSLKKQLARYKKHLSHAKEAAGRDAKDQEVLSVKEAPPQEEEGILTKSLQEAAKDLGANVRAFEDQAMLETKTIYPLSDQHGRYRLNEIHEAVGLWEDDFKQHPLSAQNLTAEDLLFFDTETTGLGSGTGHMIFLLGTGRVIGNAFHVTQYFLPGPGHETAFYYYFLSECKELTNLVTFNGKAFDWPRVKTRVQFVRDRVPKLPEFGHFDLLHASRRMWKASLESVRLSSIEEQILGMERSLDVPGHMAPFLYFQFLKDPKASLVKGVFDHNREDVLSLVTLYIHLSRLFHQKEDAMSVREQFECCRWLFSLGYVREAQVWLEKLAELGKGSQEEKAQILRLLGYAYKKCQMVTEANESFLKIIIKELSKDYSICVEIAKFYEHYEKDFDQALFFAQKALSFLENATGLKKQTIVAEEQAILHRIERLHSKLD